LKLCKLSHVTTSHVTLVRYPRILHSNTQAERWCHSGRYYKPCCCCRL